MAIPKLWRDPRSGIYKVRVYEGGKRIANLTCRTRDRREAEELLEEFTRRWYSNQYEDLSPAPPRLKDFIVAALDHYAVENPNRALWGVGR